jgi:hypothetical protein
MEQSGAWLLTQGVLGFTTLGLIAVVWRLWAALEQCREANDALQKEHRAALLSLQEKTLNALHAASSAVVDNTRAVELVTRGKVRP